MITTTTTRANANAAKVIINLLWITCHLNSKLFLSDFVHVFVDLIVSSLTFHRQFTLHFVQRPTTTF